MSLLNQEAGSLYTPSTLQQSTMDQSAVDELAMDIEGEELETTSASFKVPEKRPRGRPKGSTNRKRSVPEMGDDEVTPKRPRGRPRKSEAEKMVNLPKRGRPRKDSDAVSNPNEANITIVPTAQMHPRNREASTSNQQPEFRRSSSAYRTVQNFSLGFDNALGRWDVEQLVLNMSRQPSSGQLTVKGSIRLGFRAQELSREEHDNLGQILKAPPLQNGEQVNISFTGEATSH